MTIYQKLIENNKIWTGRELKGNPDSHTKSTNRQDPPILWIGCSESHIPNREITGTSDGEIYVHRNLANMVIHSDLNFITALDYSINELGVRHIIICGHYGCKGIEAGMRDKNSGGLSENWIQFVKDVYQTYYEELIKIHNTEIRFRRFVELNVIQQMVDLSRTMIFRKALKDGKEIELHGWVHNGKTGDVVELGNMFGAG